MAENVKPYNQTDSWDGKYTNGDDLNYALGMVRARVLAKPKTSEGVYYGMGKGLKWSATGINATPELNVDESVFSFSSGILTLPISSESPIGLSFDSGIEIGLNIGKGLYTGNSGNVSATYQKLNLNLFNQKISNVDQNMSGLELTTGTATADGAPAGNQLRIMLADLYAGSATPSNMSGLQIIEPGDFDSDGNFQTHGGLSVKYGDGLTLNNNGGLSINTGKWLVADSNGISVVPGDMVFEHNYSQSNPYAAGDDLTLVGTDADEVVGPSHVAWNIYVPLATSSIPGVIRTGYSSSGRNFAVNINGDGDAYVNVPSDNTDTWRPIQHNHSDWLKIKSTLNFNDSDSIVYTTDNSSGVYSLTPGVLLQQDSSGNNISGLLIHTATSGGNKAGLGVGPAATGYYGGIKLKTAQGNTSYSSSIKTDEASDDNHRYGVKLDSGGIAYVSVPWFTHTVSDGDVNDPLFISANGNDYSLKFQYDSNSFGTELVGDNNGYKLILNPASTTVLGGVKVGANITEGNRKATYADVVGIVKYTDTDKDKVMVKKATTSYEGVVQLSDTYSGSSDQTTAPTSKALSDAYTDLLAKITGATFHFEIFSTLPTASSAYGTTIALILQSSSASGSNYAEYACINKGTTASPNWAWEKIGDTSFELQNIGSAGVTAIVEDVFGF